MSVRTDPAKFNVVAKTAFAEVYPRIAEQIKNRFNITKGTCVDLGSGPGSLAIAMARITDLSIFSLDIQPEMTELAQQNISEAGLQKRIKAVTSDVCRMPFKDVSVDLVISRGSIFFWDNRVAAFKEINRILKPGGAAYVGGGMGNEKIQAKAMEAFATNPALRDVENPFKGICGRNKLEPDEVGRELVQAGAVGTVTRGNTCIWVEINKSK
jgi:ubiquinone/menaquinone biosynthesis C-methylase UbiE